MTVRGEATFDPIGSQAGGAMTADIELECVKNGQLVDLRLVKNSGARQAGQTTTGTLQIFDRVAEGITREIYRGTIDETDLDLDIQISVDRNSINRIYVNDQPGTAQPLLYATITFTAFTTSTNFSLTLISETIEVD